jgi:hypothetical protein
MKTSLRFAIAATVLLLIAIANRLIAPVDEPFFGGNGIWQEQNFEVTENVIDAEWIEAAPIVLAENFEPVKITNIGDRFENGIGFERELVTIYGVDEVDRTEDPISTSLDESEFEEFIQFESTTHCTRDDGSKYCDLFIAWDETLTPTGNAAEFLTVNFGDYQFAIIEKKLFESRSN